VPLGSNNPNPAIMSNRCFCYLATGCRPVGELRQDLGEDIEVVKVPEQDLNRLLREGAIDHAIVLATIALWRAHAKG
jgi:ADP-ribose pyrophosphatase